MNDMPTDAPIGMPTGANAPKPPSPPSKQEVIDWLAYQTEALVLRRDRDVLPAIAAMVAAHPVIADEDEDLAGQFAENILMAKDLIKEAVRAHKQHKEPYLTAGKAVDNWKNGYEAVVNRALIDIERIARDYAVRKHNREQAERAAEAARVAEAARIAREAAAAEARRDMWGTDAQHLAQEAERKAQQARVSARAASGAPSLNTRGDYGAKSGLVRRWKWELRGPINEVPAEHLMVNSASIMIAAKQRDPVTNKPVAVIPSIEWIEDLDFEVR